MIEAPTGIVVYRASRLEALLEPFARLRAAALREDPLAPTRVIAAHPGIQRWLVDALARRAGPSGVVANLELRLPSLWLDDLAQTVLGEGAVALAPYRREALRWRVLDAFERSGQSTLAPWLSSVQQPQQRLALADRVAGLYAQYMIYRPDWLLAWQNGRFAVPDDAVPTPLAPLWRHLRDAIGQPHRAERMARLLALLDEDPTRAGRGSVLHVFGASHLPKPVLDALRLVSRTQLVAIHLPDPCVQHWAGLRNERQTLAQWQTLGLSPAAERAYLDLGHPLLASLGRMGQHFGLALNEGEEQVVSDVRHWADRAPTPEVARSLLGRVQESIRQLEPSWVENPPLDAPRAALDDDPSLRVHSCHTRLRELEALREALLQALADDATLEPRDIVVMAPDIGAYLPLAPAVFGPAGTARGPLPWHAADVGLARTHAVFEAALALLEIPDSRITAPAVAGLLEFDPVAQALELDADARDALLQALARARIAWGIDAAARADFDVPAIESHTFAWGLSRLLAGYVYGADLDGVELPPPGVLPVEGVDSALAPALGALDRLLMAIDAVRRSVHERLPVRQWVQRVHRLFESLLRADPEDRAAQDAHSQLMRRLQQLRAETEAAGVDPAVDFTTLRQALTEKLQADAGRAPFLPGAIAFCGMVPQRAVPFRVIAVLGLDDGAFPRVRGDGGLDPMARHPRLGDREPRSDDRYLFLETLMAARDRLHLSFVGEGVSDGKPRAPAAPLGELLAFLDARHGIVATDPAAPRPWWVRQPLQPFDPRCFDGLDPRIASRDRALAAALNAQPSEERPLLPAADNRLAAPATGPVPLHALQHYYRDPARHLLMDGLGLRLDALDEEALSGDEPLDARVEARERAEQRLVADALTQGRPLPDEAPSWLFGGGLLAPGSSGREAWRKLRMTVERQHAAVVEALGTTHAPGATVAIDLMLEDLQLVGALGDVRTAADGRSCLVEVRGSKVSVPELRTQVPLFIAFAALALARPTAGIHAMLLGTGSSTVVLDLRCAAGDRAARVELARRLQGLAAFWRAARVSPPLYLPQLAEGADTHDDETALRKVAEAWIGSNGGRHVGAVWSGYARLFARGHALDDPTLDDIQALRGHARTLKALVAWPSESAS